MFINFTLWKILLHNQLNKYCMNERELLQSVSLLLSVCGFQLSELQYKLLLRCCNGTIELIRGEAERC